MREPGVAAEGFARRLRLMREREDPGVELPGSPRVEDVAPFLFDLVEGEPVEVFGAVYFDWRSRPVGYTMPYRGEVARVLAEKRHVLLQALLCDAAGMVLFHNHPSGHTVPSDEDVAWTVSFAAHAAALGLSVLDHLVLGERPEVGTLRHRMEGLGWGSAARFGREELIQRLQEAREQAAISKGRQRRRPATPKYRDPETGRTWAGRGSMARWLRAYVETGRDPEEFRIRE